MTALHPANLNLDRPWPRAVDDVGGEFIAVPGAAPADVVAEAQRLGVRALAVREDDPALYASLTDLEFLSFNCDPRDISTLVGLPRLRGLMFGGTWDGRFDFGAVPALEYFAAVELPKAGGFESLLVGHDRLHHASFGRYPFADLTPLAPLASLEVLEIVDSRQFSSLEGAGVLAPSLRQLVLNRLPALASMAHIEELPHLEYLDVGSCRHITSLDFVAALPSLRALRLTDLRDVESLKPLAGHPSLEIVLFGKTKDLDLDPIFEIPNLRLAHTGRARWNRDVLDLPTMERLGQDHPAVREVKRYGFT
jgi:hypothetical protein